MRKLVICLSWLLLTNICLASRQILVLSGGSDPGLNHYSQYLLGRYGNNNIF